MKKIVEALAEKDFYEPINLSVLLPGDRKRRFKVLNHFLLQQSPLKLCLWIFDNHGVSPQSVFGFLVNLEDSPNDVMKHILELRPQLIADQKIYYPREFLQQMQYYSSSIVNPSSAPVRILMAMVLGDDRANESGVASKLVELRALDAILSDDQEVALDMRTFNGRESQFLAFLAVVRRTLNEKIMFLADFNPSTHEQKNKCLPCLNMQTLLLSELIFCILVKIMKQEMCRAKCYA